MRQRLCRSLPRQPCLSCSRRFQSTLSSPTTSASHKVIFSGIQPTGVPHLGNYLGALRQWKTLQDSPENHECYFSVVDLHALTEPKSPSSLSQWRLETLAALLAIGLSPSQSTIFFQSTVPQHAELMWILSTIASTGQLSRMTQWKTKLGLPADATVDQDRARAKLRLGLFSYPVLQAADILLYGTTHVPIGADQVQHLELTRSLAQSFNHHFPLPLVTDAPSPADASSSAQEKRAVFALPQALLSPSPRLMSLQDPSKKMSKSDPNPNSRILITDDPETITKKIRHALTDSVPGPIAYDPETRPGVSNLIEIMYHLQTPSSPSSSPTTRDTGNPTTPTPIADFAKRHLSTLSLASLKSLLATTLIDHFAAAGTREAFLALTQTLAGTKRLREVAQKGSESARHTAEGVMREVRRRVGIDS